MVNIFSSFASTPTSSSPPPGYGQPVELPRILCRSERVYKCDAIGGTVLSEAKHINLSLHYLEQVIVCLNQENSGHIPYRYVSSFGFESFSFEEISNKTIINVRRNCLLTAILRDSLGGNCVTRMLATLSVSSVNLQV